MRIIKLLQITACAILLSAAFGAGTKADEWNRKTVATFSDSVEIPGQVLPAGTYVFKLADSIADRNIVEIWNGDETQLLATLKTLPDMRVETPGRVIFEFDERSGDSQMAIRSWFFPGQNVGRDFVYSQQYRAK
jgi:hypothetical protein